jgi:hypothetical protein
MQPYDLPDIYLHVCDDNKIELCDSVLLFLDWLSRNNPKESSYTAN